MRTSRDYQDHVQAKLAAIPLPNLKGKKLLDVGCDHGQWSFMAAEKGAAEVLGLERNRNVRGHGFINLVKENNELAAAEGFKNLAFKEFNIGKQWPCLGQFDVVLVLSVYHHIFENCGDHESVFYWLWQQCENGAILLWEGPIDCTDVVVQSNVSKALHGSYNSINIFHAMEKFFKLKYIGPALHEDTRYVYELTAKDLPELKNKGTVHAGAGGATPAFKHNDNMRIKEIAHILGFTPLPGSLNIRTKEPFAWDEKYYRAQILDVWDRSQGLNSTWQLRWCRFYPLTINGHSACAMRFEGEKYPQNFVELIAPIPLRPFVAEEVEICRV